jgi:hypothetical protein
MILPPEAEDDLANAQDWYERQRVGLGAEFLLCVEEMLERIHPPVPVRCLLLRGGGIGNPAYAP